MDGATRWGDEVRVVVVRRGPRGDEVRVVVVLRRRWCGRGGVRAAGDEGGGAMASNEVGRRGERRRRRGLRRRWLETGDRDDGAPVMGAGARRPDPDRVWEEMRTTGRRRGVSRRRGGIAASGRRRGGGAAASENERGRGSRARAREREGIGLGGRKYGWGRHNTNGAPPPGAP